MKRALLVAGAFMAACGMCAAQEKPEPAKAIAVANLSPVTHEVDLDAPVATVYDFFTTDEGYKMFGVAHAKVDLRVGGKIQSHYKPDGVLGDEGTIEQTILAYEPNRMFAFRISQPPKGFPFMNAYKDMWSVATMTAMGNGKTRLRLTQLGYTADEESQKMRAFFDQGNTWTLEKLQAKVNGAPSPAPPAAAAPSPEAQSAEDSLSPFMVETTVAAMPRDVWRSWTTSEGFKAFMGVENKIDLKLGGPFEVYFSMTQPAGSRGSEGCTILSYDPERMLSFTWNAPPKFTHARPLHTWVVVTITPHGPHASKVTLRHQGFTEQAAAHPDHAEEWKQVRAYFKNAWPNVLKALNEHYAPASERTKAEK